MKKIALAGLLALCAAAVSQQQASAWVNSRFSIGLNWSLQSGGNNFGWGAWKNGQPPGPESFSGGYAPSYGAPQSSGYAPMPQNFAPPAPQAVYQAHSTTQYGSPFQFATYPRPIYYYPTPTYYYPAPTYYYNYYGQ